MSRLSHFQRRLMRYRGMSPAHVASAERCTVEQVEAGFAELRERGHLPALREHEPKATETLGFKQLDRLMREPPSSVEIDHTTETDPRGW